MICRDTPTHGWVVGWVSGSMGESGRITNNLINLYIIKIIQFCLKIERHHHLWMGAWVFGSMGGLVGEWVVSGYITKYRINLDLIEIIQFCLKIMRHPHPWVGVWVNGWDQVK